MTDQEIKQAAGDLNAASIKPRMVDGVGWCDAGCPYYESDRHKCHYTNDYAATDEICPVWAQRLAAWAEEARGAIAEPDGILGSGFLPLDWRDDLGALLSRYPGKPTSRQGRDGE